MKTACELMGYYGGTLRKPVHPASLEAVAQIRQVLVNFGALLTLQSQGHG